MDKLRGKPGSKVTMTLFRPSTRKDIEVTLKRALIKVATVKDIDNQRKFTVDENKIGYVRLTQFGEATARDLEEALRKLELEDMKGLVLDLRHNPGGLLDQAIKVCEKFLAKGEPIVTTEGRRENAKHEASGRNARPELPLVVLVNRFSASASEIVAGCLRDNDRAKIVGEKTFGKGSVQKILPINGQQGAALRLTTAKYYTPSHQVIHGKGIEPHHEVKFSREDEELLFLRRTPGGLKMVPDNRREDVEKFVDPQLAKAMELLVGKKQLQAKTKPEEGKPEEKEKEQEPEKKEADPKPEKKEKPVEKPETKEEPKKESKPEKKSEPKSEAKDDNKPADKPE